MQEVWTSLGGIRRGAALLITSILVSLPVAAQGQSVTAIWDPSPSADQVTGYQVCVGTSSLSCNVQLSSVGSVDTSHAFVPTPGVRHYVAVRALNSKGVGAYSSEASFSIPALTQPANQSNPVGVAISGVNLTVTDPDASTLTFTHTGLPTGLTINSSTGRITGIPSAAGTYNVTVFVTDSLVTVSRSFTWTITNSSADTQAPTIAITSQTNGQTLSSASITVSGTATDSGRGGNDVSSVTVNGQAATGGTASGSATANWSRALTLSQGTNTITVQATDNRGNAASQQITLNYAISAVTSVTLSAGVASPQNTGTPVSFTANAAGGVGPRQYKFLVQQGSGAPQTVRDWSTTATYTWTPMTSAIYTVTVWARSAGATADAAQASAQMAYVINPSPVTSVSLISNILSPQATGTAITFTAAGAGGVAPRQYKFFVQQGGGAPQMVRDWSTTATYTWTPVTAASYTITVWSRSAGVTTDAAQAWAPVTYVINTPPVAPVTSATLTANLASPQNTGTPVTFTAAAGGGVGPRQYKFLVQQGSGAPQMVRDWSTTATYTWTPATASSYTVSVWARSAGETANVAQASAQMAYVINTPPSSPVTSATLTSNVASPQNTGTPVTFTAAAGGGVGPRQYKFFVQQGSGNAQMVRDWSTTATYTWTPTTAAGYTITVWARSAGITTNAAQALAHMAFVINTPPPAPVTSATLTPSVASPQTTGTYVTFVAAASGGVGPRQFKFFIQQGSGAPQMVRDWSTTTSYGWTPAAAGTYVVTVWARSAGVTTDAAQAMAQTSYAVNAPARPLSVTSLSSNLASPQASGTTITFNAVAAGGEAPYQFKWWVFDGSDWKVAQDWSSKATLAWQPTVSGDYMVAVWVRNNGVTADASQALAQVNYKVTAGALTAPLSITSLTSNLVSPQMAGATITFNAVASGGAAPYQFKWWIFDGSAWRVGQEWGTSAVFSWRPTVPGDYMVAVWGRNNGVKANASQAMAQVNYKVTAGAPTTPLSISSFTSNLASPQVMGTPITFTATATGGEAPYQFKWWVYDGSAWRVGQNWSASSTFIWGPTTAGNYMVAVWARNNAVKVDASQVMAQAFYTITRGPTAPPLTVTSLTSNVSSPQMVGTTVTFSAAATGGQAPYQFKWWVFDGSTWQIAQDWSTSATFNWRPRVAGDYMVAVWARNNGVRANSGDVMAQVFYSVTSTAPLSITSLTSNLASPQRAGSTVRFSAVTAGGNAPHQYKWWIFDGTAWKVGQNWSTNATFDWRPSRAGTYMVAVWVRNAGVKTDASQGLAQTTYIVN